MTSRTCSTKVIAKQTHGQTVPFHWTKSDQSLAQPITRSVANMPKNQVLSRKAQKRAAATHKKRLLSSTLPTLHLATAPEQSAKKSSCHPHSSTSLMFSLHAGVSFGFLLSTNAHLPNDHKTQSLPPGQDRSSMHFL